jgi:hypothetical protein
MSWAMVAIAAVGAYSSIQQGKAAEAAGEAQAQQAQMEAEQAEFDAKAQLIERKRELIKTMAAQNVGAAAQGRTISSISALQSEDVRRGQYDELMITASKDASVSSANYAGQAALSAGSSKKQASYIGAASTLLGGAYSRYKASTPAKG